MLGHQGRGHHGAVEFDEGTKSYVFKKGKILNNVAHLDEITPSPPKTQSAFLEGMEEYQVSVEGTSHTSGAVVHDRDPESAESGSHVSIPGGTA